LTKCPLQEHKVENVFSKFSEILNVERNNKLAYTKLQIYNAQKRNNKNKHADKRNKGIHTHYYPLTRHMRHNTRKVSNKKDRNKTTEAKSNYFSFKSKSTNWGLRGTTYARREINSEMKS